MRHVLDQSPTATSTTARRWAYAMQRRAVPAQATLTLQRRTKKAAPNMSARPSHFSRIERGLTA